MADVLLKTQVAKYKLTKDSIIDYHKALFSKHPDIAAHYGAEDIDPSALGRSQKFAVLAQQELAALFRLASFASTPSDDRNWKGALTDLKEYYADADVPLAIFPKTVDGLLAAVEQHTGEMTADQKSAWEELFQKAATDMKEWGWI